MVSQMDKQLPPETLEVLLKHKKEILDNILAKYKAEMDDASSDSEKLFRYGFIFAAMVQSIAGAFAVANEQSSDVLLFIIAIFFLTIALSTVLYERIRIEKAELRSQANKDRSPIMEQVKLLKGYLEP